MITSSAPSPGGPVPPGRLVHHELRVPVRPVRAGQPRAGPPGTTRPAAGPAC